MSASGELYVIAAPSGAGKTSLIMALLDRMPKLALSISDTTRPPRRGEVDGEQYFFIDPETFKKGVSAGRYLEHAKVYGHYYGTDREQVEALWAAGRDVVLEIDVQGAAQIRRSHPDACRIFILPPSLDALEARLRDRGQDRPEVIHKRLEAARTELAAWEQFDWLLVNDEFDQALRELEAVVTAWPLRGSRQRRARAGLLRKLLERG